MKWLKENMVAVILMALVLLIGGLYFITLRNVVSLAHEAARERLPMQLSIDKYAVAGGGAQFVITLSGDTATYEVVVTEVSQE